MNLYLAGRYARRSELRGYQSKLLEMGHSVTSSWLDGDHEITPGGMTITDAGEPVGATAKEFAEQDIDDMMMANMFVAFTEDPTSEYGRGGRHVELGFVLGTHYIGNGPMPHILIVGPRENLFTWCPMVVQIPTPAEFMSFAHALSMIERNYQISRK